MTAAPGPLVGGLPALVLRAPAPAEGPGVVEAVVLPGRGFMLLQARAALGDGRVVDILEAPDLDAAALRLDGGPDDFAGNQSFAFGGAILAPYANRIRGRPCTDSREIETRVGGHPVRLPRNWGGQAPGAEAYAMHGLILATPIPPQPSPPGEARGTLPAGALGERWPGALELDIAWRLAGGALRLEVTACNRGDAATPFGAGWHPYFRVSPGGRRDVVLRVPANRRAEVNDYDEVLPTGRLLDVAGTPYDFRGQGRALGDLYLDDSFTDLTADGAAARVEVRDPGSGLGLRVSGAAPVRAYQIYAPPDRDVVVVEPQFNLADPFGAEWPPDIDTGMVRLAPGQSVAYVAALEVFRLAR